MNKKIGLVLLSLLPSLVFASSSSSLNFGEAFLIENFIKFKILKISNPYEYNVCTIIYGPEIVSFK